MGFQYAQNLGSGIKSIQRVEISLSSAGSATATITSVDVNNTVVRPVSFAGARAVSNVPVRAHTGRIELTNATTVTAIRDSSTSFEGIFVADIVEYHPGIITSIQRGTLSTSGDFSSSDTISITAVDVSKSEVSCLGFSYPYVPGGGEVNDANAHVAAAKLEFTNATTLTVEGPSPVYAGGTTPNIEIGYQVIEWVKG